MLSFQILIGIFCNKIGKLLGKSRLEYILGKKLIDLCQKIGKNRPKWMKLYPISF